MVPQINSLKGPEVDRFHRTPPGFKGGPSSGLQSSYILFLSLHIKDVPPIHCLRPLAFPRLHTGHFCRRLRMDN
jgi:hypothetical protein